MEEGDFGSLFVLLRGSVASGELAAQAIVDQAAEGGQESQGAALDSLLHELCTVLLVSGEWSTRVNAAYTLRLLCRRFQSLLRPLLLDSPSDGDLLHLSQLHVEHINALSGRGATLLSGASSYLADARPDRLYNKQWLSRQQRALSRRLGLEAAGEDEKSALAAGGPESLLTLADVAFEGLTSTERRAGRVDRRAVLRQAAEAAGTATTSSSSSSSSSAKRPRSAPAPTAPADDASRETPLARLVRFLIVGLLDSRWETRHGCAVGLCAVINGLSASEVVRDYSQSSSTRAPAAAESSGIDAHDGENLSDSSPPLPDASADAASSARPAPSRPPPLLPLPPHLLEDVLCTGVGLLVLDRFAPPTTPMRSLTRPPPLHAKHAHAPPLHPSPSNHPLTPLLDSLPTTCPPRRLTSGSSTSPNTLPW